MSAFAIPRGLIAPSLIAMSLLVLTLPAVAGEVYQWKDAKGVTHYSDAPPPDKGYKNRTMKQEVPPPAADKPAENSQCSLAKRNLDALKSVRPVGLDANGDGKPDADLTAEQRAQQVQLAEAHIKANCGTPAIAAAKQ